MVRSLAIFSVVLALSVCTLAQSKSGKEAPKVKVILQAGSPVSIDENTFYPSRMRVTCRVTNRSDERIVALRLGWFATSTSQETTTHFGEMYRIPIGLRPNASIEMNPLRVPELQGRHIARITMFVADAWYSDGYRWHTDINSLRSELERRLRNVLPHREEAALDLPHDQMIVEKPRFHSNSPVIRELERYGLVTTANTEAVSILRGRFFIWRSWTRLPARPGTVFSGWLADALRQ